MRLLTLDGGAVFGYAFGDPFLTAPPFSGSHKLPTGQHTRKMIALEEWIMSSVLSNRITDIVVEEPFIGKVQSFQSIVALCAWVSHAGVAATKCQANCFTVHPQSWRSELKLPTRGPKNVLADPVYGEKFGKRKTGLTDAKRQWVKDRTLDYVRGRGCDPKDDNEADACAIWFWKAERLREKLESETRKDLFSEIEI